MRLVVHALGVEPPDRVPVEVELVDLPGAWRTQRGSAAASATEIRRGSRMPEATSGSRGRYRK